MGINDTGGNSHNRRFKGRNVQIWWDRYGGSTLESIGVKHGITRTRVRQIVCRIDRELRELWG